jgi:DNA-binding Lrp family transcriptional regulator
VSDQLTATEQWLLDRLQQGFPLEEDPYRRLGEELGLAPDEVFSLTAALHRRGVIRRLGPIYDARALGYTSTLLALEVAEEALAEVVRQVNAFPEVTHNYERRHELNCWCTVVALGEARRHEVVASIARLPGVRRALELPVRRRYKLQLAFPFADGGDGGHAGRG